MYIVTIKLIVSQILIDSEVYKGKVFASKHKLKNEFPQHFHTLHRWLQLYFKSSAHSDCTLIGQSNQHGCNVIE